MVDVAAEIERLDARVRSEVAEGALLDDIERTLTRLREAYRQQREDFAPADVRALQRFRDLAAGLRLFLTLLDRTGEISDRRDFLGAKGDFGTVLTLFAGLPVRVRMEREYAALLALEPMLTVLDPTVSATQGALEL